MKNVLIRIETMAEEPVAKHKEKIHSRKFKFETPYPKQTPNQPAAQQSYKGVLESSPLAPRPLYVGAWYRYK